MYTLSSIYYHKITINAIGCILKLYLFAFDVQVEELRRKTHTHISKAFEFRSEMENHRITNALNYILMDEFIEELMERAKTM